MKRIVTFMLALVATVSLSAQSYALHLNSPDSAIIAAGDTAIYTITDHDFVMGRAYINFYIDNLTESAILTDNDIQLVEGPSGLEFEICAGGFCPQQGPYTLQPGANPYMPLTIEPFTTGMQGKTALFRVKVGKSPSLNNSVTVYLKVIFPGDNEGIADTQAPLSVKGYPNPTTGKVTVDDREYDLSGRPAGIYYLPTDKGTARIIKL